MQYKVQNSSSVHSYKVAPSAKLFLSAYEWYTNREINGILGNVRVNKVKHEAVSVFDFEDRSNLNQQSANKERKTLSRKRKIFLIKTVDRKYAI